MQASNGTFRRLLSAIALACLFALLTGCYRVALTDLQPGSIYVEAFRNSTFYREFDENLNHVLSDTIADTTGFSSVNNREEADYVLSGKVSSISKTAIRTGKEGLPLEFQFLCTVHYELLRSGTDESLKGTVTRSWRYVPPYGETQDTSLNGLAGFMAEEIVRGFTQQW